MQKWRRLAALTQDRFMGTRRVWSRKDRARQHQRWLNANQENPPHSSSASRKAGSGMRTDKSPADEPKQTVDYYAPAFAWLHTQLFEKYENGIDTAVQARRNFWHLIPDGLYEPGQAHELIQRYAESIERQMAAVIAKRSISYWIYVYRRTAPEAAGRKDSPVTTMQVRQRLEAAFQKYARRGEDRSLAWSDQVQPEQILANIPDRFRMPQLLRAMLKGQRDLVLTDFSVGDLAQLYGCEQLAYEIWRCGAAARITSKGAPLRVDHTSDLAFFDVRSEELNTLVEIYDERHTPFLASATATVFEHDSTEIGEGGKILLPFYNVARNDATTYRDLFSQHGIGIGSEMKFNFDWVPFDIKGYCKAHLFLSDAFGRKHGFRFEVALIVIMALLYRMWEVWIYKPLYMYIAFQRAYTGPSLIANIRQIVEEGVEACADILEVDHPSSDEVQRAIEFLTFSEKKKNLISILTGGPSFVFLPSEDHIAIVDFAWLGSALDYLFLGVPLTEKGTKGKLLESLIGGTSALPAGRCKAFDDSSRQIDAAFGLGRTLIIVECKANARSIAYERGDLAALQFRRRAFEEALRQVDDKATWLSAHPKGANYDITEFGAILPVVVTPFKEFMHSLDPRYWIKPRLPRVLMPHELEELLAEPNVESIARQSASAVYMPVLLDPKS